MKKTTQSRGRKLRNWIPTPNAPKPVFRVVDPSALTEAVKRELVCEVVMGLGEWILRIECTEEEIARGTVAGLRHLIADRGLLV